MNFVFFIPDEMRAESLGTYGHPVCQTPHMDRLAREGTRFDQCHVQHTVCSPSRCSLMTGWYPHVAGHRSLWHLLRPHEPSLFRYLKQAGYQVHWYGKNDLYSEAYLAEAVDSYRPIRGKSCGPRAHAPGEAGFQSFLASASPGTVEEHGDTGCVRAAIEFVRGWRPGDRPFIVYLPLTAPHPLYGAPEPFHSMYDPASLPPLGPAGSGKPSFHELIKRYRQLGEMPENDLRKVQAVYLGMCSFSDWLLGELLAALDQTGRAADTALFHFSDHGDWAGDFGLVEKWPSGLDDCLTRIPLIARVPGTAQGHVVRECVELFDVMPTVLDLAGVACQHAHFARSLVDQLNGAAGDPMRAVFAEGGYDPHDRITCNEGEDPGLMADPNSIYYPKAAQQGEQPASVCRSTMIRTMSHKLIRRTGGENELYDLRGDPLELANRYDDPACREIRNDLTERMADWYIQTSDAVPRDKDPRGLPAAKGEWCDRLNRR